MWLRWGSGDLRKLKILVSVKKGTSHYNILIQADNSGYRICVINVIRGGNSNQGIDGSIIKKTEWFWFLVRGIREDIKMYLSVGNR